MRSGSWLWVLGGVLAGGLLLAAVLPWGLEPEEELRVQGQQGSSVHEGGAAGGLVEVGGVRRPAGDLGGRDPAGSLRPIQPDSVRGYGWAQPIPVDANPQVQQVAQSIRERKHPEQYSITASPAKFDAQGYAANPVAYTEVVEPARVFQSAQPGPGVRRLGPLSAYFQRAVQGETVTLKVQAPPKAPVTFTSFDMGQFSNRLTSITVSANEQGVAEAKFSGTPGTVEDVNILAASPLASGRVKFVVNVQTPQVP